MNAIQKQMLSTLALLVAWVLFVSTAVADPLHGRDILKFSQQPMDNTQILGGPNGTAQLYWGHDELSTAYGSLSLTGPTAYIGNFMADDFADKFSSPVVHVKWWGSYLNDLTFPNIPINKFLISFESDIPVGTNQPFSRPGEPLLNQIVRRDPLGVLTPGSGTFTEKLISGGGPPLLEDLYEYNAELHLGKEFRQQRDTVYWLKIVALVDLPPGLPVPPPDQPPTYAPRWGWHNRDYTIMDPLASTVPAVVPGEHIDGFLGGPLAATPVWHFQDDAVTGRIFVDTAGQMGQIMPVIDQSQYQPTRYVNFFDGPPPIGEFSKDLAFELYTVPEPAAGALMLIGLASATVFRRRSRSV